MTLWYITRATGVVALVLLSLATTLGLANAARLHTPRIPRFVVNSVHRTASLLAVVFVAVHVLTVLVDGYVPMPVWSAVIPFSSGYKEPWLALGVVSLDLLLAVVITSLLRRRVGNRTWRAVHWLAYLSWPDALIHSIGTGTDAGSTWMLAITAACTVTVLTALTIRLRTGRTRIRTRTGTTRPQRKTLVRPAYADQRRTAGPRQPPAYQRQPRRTLDNEGAPA